MEHAGEHTLMVEFLSRENRWRVRDAVDSGEASPSMLMALKNYITTSEYNNRGGVGHCGWMLERGLPSLKEEGPNIVQAIISVYSGQPSEN